MTQIRSLAATTLAMAGWLIACIAIAGIVSLWYAVKLALAPDPYQTPEAWVIGRAFLFGAPFAVVPTMAYLWLRKHRHANDVNLSSTAG